MKNNSFFKIIKKKLFLILLFIIELKKYFQFICFYLRNNL